MSKSVSWEVQKAIAIQTMTEAMTELDMGIIEAAKFAASATGFSHEVVRRWAFAFFCTLSLYPGSLEDNGLAWSFHLTMANHAIMQHPFCTMKNFSLLLVHMSGQQLIIRESQISQHKCFING